MVKALPGSLSEGAGSPQGLTEGVSFDGSTGLMGYERFLLALKFLSGYEHRSTLPQSRIRSTAPSEREPGTVVGAGTIQPGTCQNPGLRAIFIAPTKTQRWGHFTIQRTTLPQSRIRSTAPSGREPGTVVGAGTIHPTARKPQHCGRFSSPLRSSGIFPVCHSVYRPETAMFRAVAWSGYFERLTNSPKWSILPA